MPVQVIPYQERPNTAKEKLADAISDLAMSSSGGYVDASIIIQQVLVQLDAVVNHVSQLHPTQRAQD
jgi:hypothetical protein